MHGTVMMFLFAVPIGGGDRRAAAAADAGGARPAVPAAVGLCLLGLFRRRRLCFFASIFFGLAPDGGWFMYPPLTSITYSPGHQRRLLAAGHRLHRDQRDRRRDRDHRRRAAHARARHDARQDADLRLGDAGASAVMIVLAFPAVILGDLAAGTGARVQLAVLRSDARRRPVAVAAPVLVLRPSRGLHHLPARPRRWSR